MGTMDRREFLALSTGATTLALLDAAVRAAHGVEPPAGVQIAPGMVFIPGGDALLGSTAAEIEALARHFGFHPTLLQDETPSRTVRIAPFAIDRYEVTNAQYREFVSATGHRPPPHWNGAVAPDDLLDHPVTHVDWSDAQAYATWVGKGLPTADEWEYAARGTDGRVYPWGDAWDPERCNWYDALPRDQEQETTPVNRYPGGVSPFGVWDLAGNVAEWTADGTRPGGDGIRVVKSAGWMFSQPWHFRAAWRGRSQPGGNRNAFLGFRCKADIAPAGETR